MQDNLRKRYNLLLNLQSPLENSDKEGGQHSDEAHRGVKTSPVMQLISFANKPFPSRTPPFAPFHTSPRNGVQVNNHAHLQNHYHQEMQSHHHHPSQLQQQQQQFHHDQQYAQHHHHHGGRPIEFYDPGLSSPGLSSPGGIYNPSPPYGEQQYQHHYANWLAQQESERQQELLAKGGGYILEHAIQPSTNPYYDYVPSPNSAGNYGMDSNHNSFYGYEN